MDQVISLSEEASRRKIEPKPKLKRMLDLDHSDFNEFTGKRDDAQIFKTDIQKEMARSELVPNLEQLKELPSITQKKQRILSRVSFMNGTCRVYVPQYMYMMKYSTS